MLKLISKALLPIAMVLAACFGYTWGQGNPQYLFLVGVVILFLIDMGITIVMDKVSDLNFYKDTGLKLWSYRGTIKNKLKNKIGK